MSAFVCNDQTIDGIVKTLRFLAGTDTNRFALAPLADLNETFDAPKDTYGFDYTNHIWVHDQLDRLGSALRQMNLRAVDARYPYDADGIDPDGDMERLQAVAQAWGCTTTVKTGGMGVNPNLVYGYKLINCLMYQCGEGNVPDEPLYKAMRTVESRLAHIIVSGLKEYDDAPWGH